jgi:hypothetical protein
MDLKTFFTNFNIFPFSGKGRKGGWNNIPDDWPECKLIDLTGAEVSKFLPIKTLWGLSLSKKSQSRSRVWRNPRGYRFLTVWSNTALFRIPVRRWLESLNDNKKLYRLRPYTLAAALFLLALAPMIYLTLIKPNLTQAASLQLSTTATTIQIDVANKYRAIMTTNDTEDYLRFTDLAEGSNVTHEFAGPHINETSTDYHLRRDNNRKTTILEVTPARIKIRVEGCFDTAAGGACLTDGTNKLTVIEDYTFTSGGVFVHNQTDFRSTGITLDADGGTGNHAGYEWLGVYTDVTDAAFDDTANITYGDGQTEATTAIEAEFANTNGYVVMPGTGTNTYQDTVVGITRWLTANANGLTHEWNWDENETSAGGTTQDLITAQAQAGSSATTGLQTAVWYFLFKAEADLDTEAEREAVFNDLTNPDLPTYTTGTEWDDSSAGSSGLSFDGATDWVEMSTMDDLADGTAITYSVWVYPTAFTISYPMIMSANKSASESCLLRLNSTDGRPQANCSFTTAGIVSLLDTEALPLNRWTHLAFTYQSNAYYLYRNGVVAAQNTSLDDTIRYFAGTGIGATRAFTVGGEDGGSNSFQGRIDDARLYNTALSQAEIRQIMTGDTSVSQSSLIGYWNFNENTGSIAHDITNNNEDGTINNAVWSTGYVPDHYNEAEGTYTFDFASNQAVIDLDGGANVSTLLNGAVTADGTAITVDSTTGFPSSGFAFIAGGDKYTYTGTTATTFTGIPSTGNSGIVGHADNSVVASMNRHNPFYKLRSWRNLTVPQTITLEGNQLQIDRDYLASLKPVSSALWTQDILWYSTLQSSDAITSPNIGSAGSTNGTVAYLAGKYGNGIELNATSERVSFPIASNFNKAKGAIEFWFKPNWAHTDSTNHDLLINYSSGTNYFRFYKHSGNSLYFYIMANSTTSILEVTSGNYSFVSGQWYHLKIEWDDTAALTTQQRIYIDGIEPTHTEPTSDYNSANLTTATNMIVGDDGSARNPNGVFDEIVVYGGAIPTPIAAGGDTGNSNEYLAKTSRNQTLSFVDDDASNRGEYLYLGSDSQFQGLNVDLATDGVGSSEDFQWEYWNGTGWSSLTVTDLNSGAFEWKTDGSFYWTAPGNWFPYSIYSSTDLYYIRGHLEGGSYSTTPIENTIFTDILNVQLLKNITAADQTLSIPGFTATAQKNKGSSPITHWSMDEAYGTTTYDRSQSDEGGVVNDHHLTITNATWTVTGDSMQPNQIYLYFDGSGDYLRRNYDSDFDFGTDSFTIAGWFRHPSTNPVTNPDYLLANYSNAGYKIYMDTSGYLCFGIDDDNSWGPDASVCTTSNLGSLADSRWHHFEVVKTGTASITIYIDGKQINQNSSGLPTGSLNTNAAMNIGNDTDGGTNGWEGYLDNIFIYRYARSAEQVKEDILGPQTGVRFGK